MPNPVVRPVKPAPDVANLDALIRDVLRGGDLGQLKKALVEAKAAEARPTAPPAPRPPAAPPAPPPAAPPRTAPDRVPPPPAPPRAAADPLTPLGPATATALAAWRAGDYATTAAALETLAAVLAGAQAEVARRLEVAPASASPELLPELLPELSADDLEEPTNPRPTVQSADLGAPELPEPVLLPPIRLANALVLDGLGDPDLAVPLATALQVDVATARSFTATRHTQITLRGDDAPALEARAARVRAALSIDARVYARADVAALAAAVPVLALEARTCRLGAGSPWLETSDLLASEGIPTDGPVLTLDDVALLVLGEVEQRAWREGADGGRWLRQRYGVDAAGAERRRLVIDLHTPGRILRIVEGMTDLRRLPGGDGTSSRRAIKALLDHAAHRWPGLRVEPRRICAAGHASLGAAGTRLTSGWAAWEEHTRVCRLHRLGAE